MRVWLAMMRNESDPDSGMDILGVFSSETLAERRIKSAKVAQARLQKGRRFPDHYEYWAQDWEVDGNS